MQLFHKAVQLGLALNCRIPAVAQFDRKHYFYHDIPAGFQTTQKFAPIAVDGFVQVPTTSRLSKHVKIEQIQLEQDTGKSMQDFIDGRDASLVDLNRAGMALVEIVSGPQMETSQQALAFIRAVQHILRELEVSTAVMDDVR